MISKEKLQKFFDYFLLFVDVLMIVLILLNLSLMAVQLNFENATIRSFLQQNLNGFYHFYLPIYQKFIFIDSLFVSVFIAELLFRWGYAIYAKTYHRWFFFPFARWYDVLGCIPVSSFRILRVLRIIAIIIRLHKLKVINVKKFYLYQQFVKYMGVLTEEVSDRVVVNVINEIQNEIQSGIPLTEKIIQEVVIPKKDVLINFISQRIQKVTSDQYQLHQKYLQQSIERSVKAAMQQNESIKKLQLLPVIGPLASSALQEAVHDITFQTIHHIFQTLASTNNRAFIEKITDGIIETILLDEEDETLKNTFNEMLMESLDLVKDQVKLQQWKLKEAEKNKLKQEAEAAKKLTLFGTLNP